MVKQLNHKIPQCFIARLPRLAPPRCPTVRRPAQTRPWYFWVWDSTKMLINYPACLARTTNTETKRRRPTGQQPGTKSGRGPTVNPVVNWSSIYRCVPLVDLSKVLFVLASRKTSKTVVYGARLYPRRMTRRRPALAPRPAPLRPARRSTMRRPAPPHPCYVRVLDSTNPPRDIRVWYFMLG